MLTEIMTVALKSAFTITMGGARKTNLAAIPGNEGNRRQIEI